MSLFPRPWWGNVNKENKLGRLHWAAAALGLSGCLRKAPFPEEACIYSKALGAVLIEIFTSINNCHEPRDTKLTPESCFNFKMTENACLFWLCFTMNIFQKKCICFSLHKGVWLILCSDTKGQSRGNGPLLQIDLSVTYKRLKNDGLKRQGKGTNKSFQCPKPQLCVYHWEIPASQGTYSPSADSAFPVGPEGSRKRSYKAHRAALEKGHK